MSVKLRSGYNLQWVCVCVVGLLLTGCGGKFDAELYVEPSSEVPPDGTTQVKVRVKNPPPGLRYVWHASRGTVDPQESSNLTTTYTAPRETGEDRVTLEIKRERSTLFKDEVVIYVREREERAPEPALHPQPQPAPPEGTGTGEPVVRITTDPPYDPVGGPGSSADIAGEVSGVEDPTRFYVVLYAFTDYWYVQPMIATPLTEIGDDGKWSTWTHTGTKYVVLLVRPGFQPQSRMSRLPFVGGNVVAISPIVEGKK